MKVRALVFTAALVVPAVGHGRSLATQLEVQLEKTMEYNPPPRWIPPEEDKAGYFEKVDYGSVEAFDFSLQSSRLAALTEDSNHRTHLFLIDLFSGDVKHRIEISRKRHDGPRGIRLSPDGRTVAVPEGDERQISLWDVNTGQLKAKGTTDEAVSAVDWHPGGDSVAVAGRKSIELWSTAPLARQKFLRGARADVESVMSVGWSPDGQYLAVGTNHPSVYIFAPQTGTGSPTLEPRPKGSVYVVRWSPNGQLLAGAGFGAGSSIQVWRNAQEALKPEPSYRHAREFPAPTNGWWTRLTWDSSGELLAFGDNKGSLSIWEIGANTLLKTFAPHPQASVLEAHWKGDRLITVGSYPDKKFRVWRIERRDGP